MMSSDIHALSGAYAVDALDDIERAQFERHLKDCDACRAEVDDLRDTTALLAEATMTAPPAALRDRVLADIATVRPLAPQVAETTAPRHSREHRSGRRWLPGLVAAAAITAVVGVGVVVTQPWSDDSSQTQNLSAADLVRQAPDAQTSTQRLAAGGELTVIRSVSLNQAVAVTKGVTDPPAGSVYELWLQDAEDGFVPAGLMPVGGNELVLDGNAANAVAAAMTVEPEGGSNVPTTDPVAKLEFKSA